MEVVMTKKKIAHSSSALLPVSSDDFSGDITQALRSPEEFATATEQYRSEGHKAYMFLQNNEEEQVDEDGNNIRVISEAYKNKIRQEVDEDLSSLLSDKGEQKGKAIEKLRSKYKHVSKYFNIDSYVESCNENQIETKKKQRESLIGCKIIDEYIQVFNSHEKQCIKMDGLLSGSFADDAKIKGWVLNNIANVGYESLPEFDFYTWADEYLPDIKPTTRKKYMTIGERSDCHKYTYLGLDRLHHICTQTKRLVTGDSENDENIIPLFFDRFDIDLKKINAKSKTPEEKTKELKDDVDIALYISQIDKEVERDSEVKKAIKKKGVDVKSNDKKLFKILKKESGRKKDNRLERTASVRTKIAKYYIESIRSVGKVDPETIPQKVASISEEQNQDFGFDYSSVESRLGQYRSYLTKLKKNVSNDLNGKEANPNIVKPYEEKIKKGLRAIKKEADLIFSAIKQVEK
jgi:hypothetical protein